MVALSFEQMRLCQALFRLPFSAPSPQVPGLTGLVAPVPGTLVVSGRPLIVVKILKSFYTNW